MKKSTPIIFLIFLSTSCAWLDECQSEVIIGDYYIGWCDLEENRSVNKLREESNTNSKTILQSYVFEVGNNEDYIIAKQRSYNGESIKYFIIEIQNNDNVIGPLSLNEFKEKSKVLKISNLIFRLKYSEILN